MSKMGNLVLDIQDDIEQGELSFQHIAVKHGVTLRDVDAVAFEIMEHDMAYEGPSNADAYLDAVYEDRYCVEDF